MYKSKIILSSILFCTVIAGCKWQDDFRARRQPELLEQPRRPTLNIDSVDYEGNQLEEEAIEEGETCLPAIDGRSEIPEVPEYPAGV
ncbi:MAG TPA: hypothetical protein PLD88_04145 [Candidatus Berkiella sp.]|nr:hypothetical protein [Candidatus Berkiella sp.]